MVANKVTSVEAGLKMLKHGRVEYCICDLVTCLKIISQSSELKIDSFSFSQTVIPVTGDFLVSTTMPEKSRKELITRFKNGLGKLKKDNRLRDIFKKHMGAVSDEHLSDILGSSDK